MLSLIEVQCPHCGARGQIMIPPVGAIIIGPCPQCRELVVVFCGHVLALEKDLMESGSVGERRDHLLSVLTGFLQERVTKLLSGETPMEDEEMGDFYETPSEGPEGNAEAFEGGTPSERGKISQSEFERFTDVDLKLLDNTAYFKSVFEHEQD